MNETITVSVDGISVSAPLKVVNGQTAVVVKGLKAQVKDFVTLSGDFGFQKTTAVNPANDELLVVSSNAAAKLTVGTAVEVGVSGATVALVVHGDGKLALQATGTAALSLGSGFATDRKSTRLNSSH